MLSSLMNIFRVADLRNKVVFTLVVVALYQLGANVPVPGVSLSQIHALETQAKSSGVLSYLDLFSGGALTRFAVFGLGIMPYITSSIIIQLLTTVIPKLEQWRDQGPVGERKITQTTRYLTVGLALMQATGLAFVFHGNGGGLLGTGQSLDLIPKFTIPRVTFIVLTLTAGTAFVMWLAELITQRGVGNGMSILIFANVVAGMPAGGAAIFASAGALMFSVIFALTLVLMVSIVFMELGQRRIQVTFAKRVVGRRMYGGQSTYIPLKVNQAGVVPIIFASSVLYFPVLLSNIIPWTAFRAFVSHYLTQSTSYVYISIYGVLIVMFTYFYVTVQFDPHQQSEIIRKQGGFIPGIRPGPSTERYLSGILNRITLPGSLFLASVALLPSIVMSAANINNYPFLGTTILIAVGVALETMKQVDSQLMQRNYEGFLR